MKKQKGQTVVEFTLVFIMLIVIVWIPADFGLAFYTGQLMQNASREGARIAAASKDLQTQIGTAAVTCTVPCTSGAEVLQTTSKRARLALIRNPTITMLLDPGTNCDRLVTVTVQGDHQFFFYRILNYMRLTSKSSQTITRAAAMRWEHQC